VSHIYYIVFKLIIFYFHIFLQLVGINMSAFDTDQLDESPTAKRCPDNKGECSVLTAFYSLCTIEK